MLMMECGAHAATLKGRSFAQTLPCGVWLKNYNTMSYIVATSTIQYSSWKHDWWHWSHILPNGYTADSQNSVWTCYPCVAPQQLYKGLKCKTKHC